MKLLAQTENGYLIESTSEELANILGHSRLYEAGVGMRLKIGDEIKVSELYKQLKWLHENQDLLTKVAVDLNNYADKLASIEPVLRDETPPA